jgi:hypothetical protein
MSKIVALAVIAGLTFLLVGSLPEIKRYMKIREM